MPNGTKLDPWVYIDSLYNFKFTSTYGSKQGIPCDEVESYDNATLKAANLKRENRGKGTGAFSQYLISYCSPEAYFAVNGYGGASLKVS